MEYFLLDGQNQIGPYKKEQVIEYIKNGRAQQDTLAWSEGMLGWEPLGTLLPDAFDPNSSYELHAAEAQVISGQVQPNTLSPAAFVPIDSSGKNGPSQNPAAWPSVSVEPAPAIPNKVGQSCAFGCAFLLLIPLVTLLYACHEDAKGPHQSAAMAKATTPEQKITVLMQELFHSDLREVKVIELSGSGVPGPISVAVTFHSYPTLIKFKMADAYNALYTSKLQVQSALITASADLQDKYGYKSEDPVYITRLNIEKAKLVNWSNYESVDFTKIWDAEYMHRAVAKVIKDQ
jgi:GYF domain 2